MMSNSRNNGVDELSRVFKALSNPHRLRIFMRLINCCGSEVACKADSDALKRCVGEISKDLGIVASTVSHHIKELHQAGLIRMERRGQNVNCWVDGATVKQLIEFLAELESK